jgi:ATP-binding protein involved in chromosome partitioning
LSVVLREAGDAGSPAVLSAPDDAAAAAIASLAETLATRARGLAGRSLPFA